MSIQRKLLILHDSADFGGHERMLIALMPGLFAAEPAFDEVAIFLPAANTRLQEALSQTFPAVRQILSPFTKKRGEPYFRHVRFTYRRAVRELIAAERPDTVLLVQGRIENLAVPLSVIPSETRVVSYVPMAHRMSEMGRSGTIGDRVRRPLYRRPDLFIVPSETVARQVSRAGGTSPVAVAHNVVSPPPRLPQRTAREMLDLPLDRQIGLFIGRLDLISKGIDALLDALQRSGAARLQDWTFLFVGDGPGRDVIADFAARHDIDTRIISWTDHPDRFMAAADILLLPSRWEGVPLVMLEAMEYGLPILASDIDVYRMFLPPSNVCDYRTVELAETIQSLTRPAAADAFAANAKAKLAPLTIDASCRTFADAVTGKLAA